MTDSTQWSTLTTGAYCNYGNNVNNASTYGHLYNWYAATDSRRICPLGWHIPDTNEWIALANFLGRSGIAGGKMKAISSLWNPPNTAAANSSGFSALPGGYKFVAGNFNDIGNMSWFWELNHPIYGGRILYHNSPGLAGTYSATTQNIALSCRCVKD